MEMAEYFTSDVSINLGNCLARDHRRITIVLVYQITLAPATVAQRGDHHCISYVCARLCLLDRV